MPTHRARSVTVCYRSGRSPQDAVLQLITTVTTCIDAKASNSSRCLFLDFSSTFNTINVSLLIDKLQHLDSKGKQNVTILK